MLLQVGDERKEGQSYALTHAVSLSAAYLVVMIAMRYFLQQQNVGSASSLSLFALEARGDLFAKTGFVSYASSELSSKGIVFLICCDSDCTGCKINKMCCASLTRAWRFRAVFGMQNNANVMIACVISGFRQEPRVSAPFGHSKSVTKRTF